MDESRFKVLAVASHPVQYMAPIFRRMAVERSLDLQVAYCSLRGATKSYDPDFRASVKWDVPLLDGYHWVEVPNKGSGDGTFWGLNNPGLRGLIRDGKFEAVLCYLSYLSASFWIVQRAAKNSGAALLFGTDAHSLASRDGKPWKAWLKRLLWPWLFRRADQILVPSTGTLRLIESLGIPEDRITLTPYTVDNDWWRAQSAKVDRDAVRSEWGVRPGETVILFCAKLQPWKRPMDLLHAFAQAGLEDSLLVFAGDGAQRAELEAEAAKCGIERRVRFLGFVNQSELPRLYTAADLMVLPSRYEPFGVVVNEAMCCGCPVVVSDQVGAARDLVAPLSAELIVPCGDIPRLAGILRRAHEDRAWLTTLSHAAKQRMDAWSLRHNLACTVEAVERAVERRRGMDAA